MMAGVGRFNFLSFSADDEDVTDELHSITPVAELLSAIPLSYLRYLRDLR
jgi:hypothetical protein